jgi:hypothetical protein
VTLRRPSAPIVIALLALFVALDGPAHAQRLINGKLLKKGTVTSRAVKDRSLQVKDIKRKSVRKLQKTRNGSITEAKLANSSVTPGKLAPGAVGSSAIADRGVGGTDLAPSSVGGLHVADGSLGGADVADGALDARDLGRFWGRFRMQFPAIEAGDCWSGAPGGLGPELAGADISQDLVVVTPGAEWPEALAFTVHNDGNASRFVLAGCNKSAGPTTVPAFESNFRYLVIDLP